ncbi:hypothetical protein BOTBODRAFT_177207 [Botryobasidium botryosum FD-172 SS1]|uniref:Uncharacterized protein n=1 Tax=Botryobasidium botryosum (strain FD-172 SS1) TaxID=930990 RepID=A0A067M735_BOTB1|nr:hypothetical protein BOTBODRAFT_177207 [Botryobasidium botryosum FD-172 SS1]
MTWASGPLRPMSRPSGGSGPPTCGPAIPGLDARLAGLLPRTPPHTPLDSFIFCMVNTRNQHYSTPPHLAQMPSASSSLPTLTPDLEAENFSTPTSAHTLQPPLQEWESELSTVDELSSHLSQLGFHETSSSGSRETPPTPRPTFPDPFSYKRRHDPPPHRFLSAPAPSHLYAHPNPWSPPPQATLVQAPYAGFGAGSPHFQPRRRRTEQFEERFTPTPPPAAQAPPPPPPPPPAPVAVLNIADPAVQQALVTIVQIVQQGQQACPAHVHE